MYKEEKQLLAQNITWFRDFFVELEHLFHQIQQTLEGELGITDVKQYNPVGGKYTSLSFPRYAMFFAVFGNQGLNVFFILDTGLIRCPGFVPEPSFIVVQHSNSKKFGYIENASLNILLDENIVWDPSEPGSVRGRITGGEIAGATFTAFQVLMDSFIEKRRPKDVIMAEFVERLKVLD